MESTFLHQYRSYGAASFIQLGLNHQTSGTSVRICFQLQNVRSQQNGLQQILDTFTGLCGYGNKLRGSAPVRRNQFVLSQFLLYTVDICRGLINLIYGDNDLNPRRLCMIDCLNGLGHNAVVCRHSKDCDIRGICAAHTHSGKRFVSGRIQKRNLSVLHVDSIRTDMLCDTACLLVDDIGLTNRVKQ